MADLPVLGDVEGRTYYVLYSCGKRTSRTRLCVRLAAVVRVKYSAACFRAFGFLSRSVNLVIKVLVIQNAGNVINGIMIYREPGITCGCKDGSDFFFGGIHAHFSA